MQLKESKKELLIGLLSDTHLQPKTPSILKRVLDDFKERKVDYVFHMGDFTSNEVHEYLAGEIGKDKIIAVRGNMDIRDKKLINTLPESLEFELYDHKIFMTHGSGAPHGIIERLNRNYDLSPYDIVIFGHTHHPMNKKSEKDGKLYLNPGTCESVDGKPTIYSSYGYLTISKNTVQAEIVKVEQISNPSTRTNK